MQKNLFAAFLLILTLACAFETQAYAQDADAEMNAALADQSSTAQGEPETGAATPVIPAAAAPVVPPAAETPAAPSEPVIARDVLTDEQKEESAPEENSETPDEEGVPAPSKNAALEAAAASGQLMIADFNTGDKPNNLGGDFGGWDKDPNDDTQGCRATFASDDADGDMEGFALRLDYDVDSPSPAYNGFWMKLENLNATPFDTLSMYVRGASQRFTKRMKVEFKTPDSRSSSFMMSGISGEWQKIEIPLKRFKGIKDWRSLTELILVFDDVNTAPKKGTILVDQIMLERKEQGMLPATNDTDSTGYVLSSDKGPIEKLGKED